jgi:hypothetical protein
MNFLTVEQFADKIKMSTSSVRKSIREGKIFASRPSMGIRAPYRIPDTELERLHLETMYVKPTSKKTE